MELRNSRDPLPTDRVSRKRIFLQRHDSQIRKYGVMLGQVYQSPSLYSSGQRDRVRSLRNDDILERMDYQRQLSRPRLPVYVPTPQQYTSEELVKAKLNLLSRQREINLIPRRNFLAHTPFSQ